MKIDMQCSGNYISLIQEMQKSWTTALYKGVALWEFKDCHLTLMTGKQQPVNCI